MRFPLQIVLATCLLAVCTSAGEKNPDEVRALAARVDHHYHDVHTLRANFTETYRGPGAPDRNESGTLWLERGGKMRWEYHQPHEKLFLSDGKTAYFFVPGERQARRAALRSLDDLRSPLRYLLGTSRLEKEFQDLRVTSGQDSGGNYRLEGTPRGMRDRIQRVQLEINAVSQIERIQIEEVDGAITEFVFLNLTENVSEPAARFRLKLPPGVEIIEGEIP